MNSTADARTLPFAARRLPPAASLDALQSRFALRVASHLTERSADLGPEWGERLRVAREQALERARQRRRATVASDLPVATSRGGSAVLGRGGASWWVRLATVLPALALAAGLFTIQRLQDNAQISTAAEVDAALLADDLPPSAYRDVGFVEFLMTPGE